MDMKSFRNISVNEFLVAASATSGSEDKQKEKKIVIESAHGNDINNLMKVYAEVKPIFPRPKASLSKEDFSF